MMKLIGDLRFVIGAFFTLVGLLLVVMGLVAPELRDGVNLNLRTGATMLAFGVFMLVLSLRGNK